MKVSITIWYLSVPNCNKKIFSVWQSSPVVSVSTPIIVYLFKRYKNSLTDINLILVNWSNNDVWFVTR